MKRCANKIQLLYQLVQNYFWKDVGLSSDQETKKNGVGLCLSNLAGNGTQTAQEIMRNFAESCHPAFRCPNQFSRGVLKNRGGEISSIHYSADPKTVELLLKTIIAVNQLSIFRSKGEVVQQQQQVGRNSRVSGPMTRTVLCHQSRYVNSLNTP